MKNQKLRFSGQTEKIVQTHTFPAVIELLPFCRSAEHTQHHSWANYNSLCWGFYVFRIAILWCYRICGFHLVMHDATNRARRMRACVCVWMSLGCRVICTSMDAIGDDSQFRCFFALHLHWFRTTKMTQILCCQSQFYDINWCWISI